MDAVCAGENTRALVLLQVEAFALQVYGARSRRVMVDPRKTIFQILLPRADARGVAGGGSSRQVAVPALLREIGSDGGLLSLAVERGQEERVYSCTMAAPKRSGPSLPVSTYHSNCAGPRFSVSPIIRGIEKTLDLIDSAAGVIVANINESTGVL
jgi:hypothetical protein